MRNAMYNAQGSSRGDRFGEDIATGICAAASWRQAVNDTARVVVTCKEPPPPPAVANRYYFSLPDPFGPLLDLWQLGYTLDAITADAVVLVAPEVAAQSAVRCASASALPAAPTVHSGAGKLRERRVVRVLGVGLPAAH